MSITTFMEEIHQEEALKAAYRECWKRLMTAVQQLDLEELEQLSNPFLVKALPAYRKAKRKVLFVGQETNGWESFSFTLENFKSREEEVRRENIIEYLQWMYEDFRFHRRWDHTPFWRAMRRLYQVITPDQGDDGFLHTELVRFDYAKKRPPQAIETLLQREYNVLPMEISALAPEVIIFFTGPEYDERLRETFQHVGGLGHSISFEPVRDLHPNALARVVHPKLPYHTYRTYHPNYSLHYNEKTIFHRIEAVLPELISKKDRSSF